MPELVTDGALEMLAPGEPRIARRVGVEPCPLSFAQQRLWFLNQLAPNNHLYNIATAVRLQGRLDITAVRDALNALVARHEALRTTFPLQGEEPVQAVADRRTVELLLDLQELRHTDSKLEEALRAEARRPFDLSCDLMLRALLVRRAPDDHVLLLTIHHIAFDDWSIGVLTRELGELYAAHIEGRPAALPPLPIQYGDYALWQHAALTGEAFRTQLAYWTQRLAGMPSTLQLPTDRPRPTVLGHQGAQVTAALPPDLVDALRTFSRRERVTLFMTLLTAFQTLLHRYTGTDDIVVGTAVAGRRPVEIEGLIGFFVNTLALRTDLSGDPTFRAALARVREVVLGAFDHQDVPFEKVVEALRPERSLSRLPLVQVTFTLQDPDPPALALARITVTRLDVDPEPAEFDLAVSVTDTPDGLAVRLTYNTELYEPATIHRMLGHYQTLLRGVVADPDQHLSRLPLLTPAERQQLLVEWNATAAPVPRECVHQLFEAQVRRAPEAVALTLGDQSLTYQQLNQRANQLARYLQRRGVGPDVLVGLCLERSLDMIVGLLGILKAGGAYVPLDPGDPPDRFAFMLRDAQVSVLVTHRPLLHRLAHLDVPAVCLDDEWPTIAQEEAHDLPSPAAADNLAYVIYTSGSTGTPKGVMISHRGVSNLMAWRRCAAPINANDIVVQRSPITFDASVNDVFQPLLAGAKLVLLPPGAHRDPRALSDAIRTACASWIALVPSLMQALVEEPGLKTCTSLRLVTCEGEAWSWNLLRRFRECLDVELVNVYGPTETTVNATAYTVPTPGPVARGETVPIGRPMANAQLYILDPHMQPVPVGVPGELYIGGGGLARGYLRRPELTAERFVPHPFSGEPGARLYKTGDRARYLPDGNIEFLGRLDYQVKIRGFRIELGEIETVLREHPGVRDAVVVVREPAPGDKRLVAYLVPRPSVHLTPDSVRRFAQAKLPEYMIPSAFVPLPAFPLTSSGKVDRRSLPMPDRLQPAAEYASPRDAIEHHLVPIWEELLGVHPVGVTDNFFDLGGHSLLASRLLVRVRALFQVDVSMRAFFADPTVAGVAAALVQSAVNGGQADAMPRTLEHSRSDKDARRRAL